MATEFEYCIHCDDLTGRAGQGDDSIFLTINGDEIGPLCENCFDSLTEEYGGDAAENYSPKPPTPNRVKRF